MLSYCNCGVAALVGHKCSSGSTHCFFRRRLRVRDQLIIMFDMFTINSHLFYCHYFMFISDPAPIVFEV